LAYLLYLYGLTSDQTLYSRMVKDVQAHALPRVDVAS
jgi:hypothetical protein